MALKDLNLGEVLDRFEKEMFKKEDRFEIADGTEFELFSKSENELYVLQFNREEDEQTYSICMMNFEPNGGDYIDTVYLETYPMAFYNREFLTSRIVKYMEEIILPLNRFN